MRYSFVADTYEMIENTTKRLEMTEYLVNLLRNTSQDIIDKLVYLTQGKLHPDFKGVEFGIAEKLTIRAIAKATGQNEDEIQIDLKKTGDLDLACSSGSPSLRVISGTLKDAAPSLTRVVGKSIPSIFGSGKILL